MPMVKSDPARKEPRSTKRTVARGCALPFSPMAAANFFRTCPLRGALSMQPQVGQDQPGSPARPPTPRPTLSYVAVKAPPLLFILFLGSPSLDCALRPALILRTEHKGPSVHAPSSRKDATGGLKLSRRLVTVLAVPNDIF
jgi:hypothetical protein